MTLSATAKESIARTAKQYDALPYGSKPYVQTHPSRTGGIAKLFGLNPPPLERARILELGCSSGGNLIPFALQYPQSHCVGIDISARQIEQGKDRLVSLGLGNMELLCQSLTDFDPGARKFDYIICHGVFSWVPREVQDAIFRLCRQALAPAGIAMVSYNVLPGWRRLQPLRDAFLMGLPPELEGEEKVAAAFDLARFLLKANGSDSPYAKSISSWLEKFADLPVSYIAHEFLEDINEPLTFRDFASRASDHGLGYLAEVDFHGMVPQHYAPEIAAEIEARSGRNLLIAEQLIDLIQGRTFRQSLLLHEEQVPFINRNLNPDCLDGLNFIGSKNTMLEVEEGVGRISIDRKEAFVVKKAAVIAAVKRFLALYPGSGTIHDLAAKTADQDEVKKGFFALVTAGAVLPLLDPVPALATLSERPRASEMARRDAAAESPYTTNLRHESVSLDLPTQYLLQAMTGEYTVVELIASLENEIATGQMVFHEDDSELMPKDKAIKLVRERAPGVLQGLVLSGLIEG